jgi:GDP-4-dehydro-6-deoxy-D-mannose reductase
MRVLVTGADGFVGGRLVRRLTAAGHAVTAAVRRGTVAPSGVVRACAFDLRDGASVREATAGGFEAAVHLAAVASGADARLDPGTAWEVNAAGTARLCEALAAMGASAPRFLLVSTAEVYGAGPPRPRRESDPPAPCSPYAASKLGAEVAATEVGRRTGMRVIIVRPFPHTGGGQDTRFVAPAFAQRIREALHSGQREVRVGNLDPIRDFLHVDDVADAYLALLECEEPGPCYNVAAGSGVPIREVFERLRRLLGADVRATPDPALMRPADIPHLVGDAARLRTDTGWRPRRTLDDALGEVARAETH